MHIPAKGLKREEVLAALEQYKKRDLDWSSGRAFGYVFDPGEEIVSFAKEIYTMFLSESGLDFTVYPSLLQMENELISLMRHHLGGDDQVVGHFTSGGTESILLAVKAARDYFRQHRPEITEPEMVLPTTAHAAFHKAAHYFGIKAISVSVDPQTFQADVARVREALSDNTIMLMGSAPSYTHGMIDPIQELSELAAQKGLWFHTDACMGGFLLPYFRRLGQEVPDFDFAVPGVWSLSVDLHKYAYTPKGASVILYRKPELRRYQMFAFTQWVGYTMINPTVQSTKSGGPLAAAWATLHYVGEERYLDFARRKLKAVEQLKQAVREHPDLELIADSQMTLISLGSQTVNIFHIIDEMNLRGWYIQPALAYDNSPANIHLSINLSNVDKMDEFIAALKDSVAQAKQLDEPELWRRFQELWHEQGEALLDKPDKLMELAGITEAGLPQRSAGLNQVLNALPADKRQALLLEFADNAFQPRE
jgi:glutamate/tyrosine decarboxylase-like PLP-dependent enzyme